MNEYRYCCQCTEAVSGKRGCFVFAGGFQAISPIFESLAELLPWMEKNGYRTVPGTWCCTKPKSPGVESCSTGETGGPEIYRQKTRNKPSPGSMNKR